MKVLYIAISCDPYNGSEDQIGWQVPWECAKTDEVFVVTRTDLKNSIDKFLGVSERRNIKLTYVSMPKYAQKLFRGTLQSIKLLIWNKKAMPVVKKICKKQGIDIIHQITPIEFRSVGKYYTIRGVKCVCGPLGAGQYIPQPLMRYVSGKDRINEMVRSVVNSLFKKSVKKKLKKFDKVLFTNRETQNYLGFTNISKNEALIYDNGICEDELDEDRIKELVRNRENKSIDGKIRFIIVGRLIYIKGHDFLFDVLEKMPDRIDYEVRIIGDGPLRKHIEDRVKSEKLNGKVTVVGSVPYTAMNEEYKDADVMIFCSLRESSGTVILEAMKNALPTIALNKFGAALILNENNSWMICGNTYDELQKSFLDALIECCDYPNKIREKGDEAFADAHRLTWKSKVKTYRQIYTDLL